MDEQDYQFTVSKSFTGATTNSIVYATSSEIHITNATIELDATAGIATLECYNEHTLSTTTIARTTLMGTTNTGNIRADCVGNILYNKTLAGNSLVVVTYRPEYIPGESVVSCLNCTSSIVATSSATTTQLYTQGFTYGEILISFLLLIMVTNAFFGGILDRLLGKKIKKQYKVILK